MKDKSKNSDTDEVVAELRNRQRNTVWPDTMHNSKSVDEFLWKGSPDAPLVQRIGAWIFGLFFILCGLGWFAAAYERHSRIFGICSIPWFFIGARVFLNGFRRKMTAKDKPS